MQWRPKDEVVSVRVRVRRASVPLTLNLYLAVCLWHTEDVHRCMWMCACGWVHVSGCMWLGACRCVHVHECTVSGTARISTAGPSSSSSLTACAHGVVGSWGHGVMGLWGYGVYALGLCNAGSSSGPSLTDIYERPSNGHLTAI